MSFYDYISIISYSLTALGFIMTNMLWLRVFMIIACVMDVIIYMFIRPGEPLWIQVGMNTLFVLINSFALIRLIQDKLPPKFYGEIGEIYNKIFYQLTPREFKALLAIAQWQNYKPGVMLIREGDTNINPMLILQGQVAIVQHGVKVTTVGGINFVGEINFLTELPASNNVITTESTRLLVFSKSQLQALVDKDSRFKSIIFGCFGMNVATKLKLMTINTSLGGLGA